MGEVQDLITNYKEVENKINEIISDIQIMYKEIPDYMNISFNYDIVGIILNLVHTLESIDKRDSIILYFHLGRFILYPTSQDLPACLFYLTGKYNKEKYPDIYIWIDKFINKAFTYIKK